MNNASPSVVEEADPWWRNDAVTTAALILVAVVGFAVTYTVSKTYTRREDALARRWYQAGETALSSNNPKAAISDFRTALLYSRDNPRYRLRLAEALAADNDTPQAIAYFLNLWEEQPGSGPINLELGHLYARQRQPRQASQYFNNAIYGVWQGDPITQRRQARVEYVKFLMQQNQVAQAQAEAVALLASTPPSDSTGRLQAADLMFSIGDYEHALNEYKALLSIEPAQAALGAGKAAFNLAWYHTASEYLRAAVSHGADDNGARLMLARADAVTALDPWQRHLSAREAAKRVQTAYVQAGSRLQDCAASKQQPLKAEPPTTDLQQLYAEWEKAGSVLHRLSRDSDLRDSLMDMAFRIEAAAEHNCGQPTSAPDWALATLSRLGEGVER